jgi:predicted protein tyrosine phosphatase
MNNTPVTKTQGIFDLTAPYNNHSQGPFKRILFVCSVGMLRSPTAAVIGAQNGFNTRSCGSSSVALIPLSANLILWADWIIFMNRENYLESKIRFHGSEYLTALENKAITWDINDFYNYMDDELKVVLKDKIQEQYWTLNEG